MSSLQLSNINPPTDNISGNYNLKGASRLSASSSSLILKTFKEKLLTDILNTCNFVPEDKHIPRINKTKRASAAKSRSKSSVFNRLYNKASSKKTLGKWVSVTPLINWDTILSFVDKNKNSLDGGDQLSRSRSRKSRPKSLQRYF